MEYNSLSFLDDLVSTRGYEANEKLKRLHGESFGPYTIHASYYNGVTEILTFFRCLTPREEAGGYQSTSSLKDIDRDKVLLPYLYLYLYLYNLHLHGNPVGSCVQGSL